MEKSCCFTGHRPEKLDISIEELEARLKTAIDEAVKYGFYHVYNGYGTRNRPYCRKSSP